MAKKDLAKLAALGALGYMLTRGGKGKESTTRGAGYQSTETREEPRRKIEDYQKKAPAEPREAGIAAANDVRASRVSPAAVKDNTTGIRMPSGSPDAEAGMSRGTRGESKPASTVSSSEKGMKNYVPRRKSTASSSAEGMKNYAPRRGLSSVDQIPGQNRSGPVGGERVSGSEMSRNVSNTLNALAPMGGGVGKVGAELATSGRVQRAYNAAQAERRAAEGMSPAEALAAREAAREAKTLNPNAWLAGPKGMAENFRKGGAVKKMASGGMARSASSRADGIASRGKTKCKMY